MIGRHFSFIIATALTVLASCHTAKQSTTGSGKATIEQHDISGTLTEFVLDDLRTVFRKSRLKNLDILQLSFKDSFTLTTDQLIDTDW